MHVHQLITPKWVRSQIAEFGTTQLVVAEFAGIDNAQFSLFLNGHRGLSAIAQQKLYHVFEYFEDLSAQTDLPVNFSNVTALRPRWKQWCEARAEAEVVRTETELRARTANAPTGRIET